ncbi:MAG: hypothetical protein RI572_04160 [Salegentibacter sp.]|uniref:HEPN domain-containing protein n=1 Tax=Salegentibacter flavus TaxID=287099 RepID=A0A1I5AM01_9FLAO|nr:MULTISPECIES: hypothetical protein [Salegentibacter]MDR9456586.1 hypothetical protein [Salegentibacter sp.]SFN63473.1 hypothetical protein SAMN05660413_01934 [Salegentibacter flavus]
MKANNNFFDEALEKLSQANDEFFRPEEDLVTYSVCKNAQFSIENFLKGYLLKHQVEVDDCKTLDCLYEKCLNINKNFAQLDLSALQCGSHTLNTRDCSDVPKVSKCLNAANKLEALLKQEQVIV